MNQAPTTIYDWLMLVGIFGMMIGFMGLAWTILRLLPTPKGGIEP